MPIINVLRLNQNNIIGDAPNIPRLKILGFDRKLWHMT